MGRHKKPEVQPQSKTTPEQELFLRKKVDYLQNCCEHLKWEINRGAIDLKNINSTADAIIQHGKELKQRFPQLTV